MPDSISGITIFSTNCSSSGVTTLYFPPEELHQLSSYLSAVLKFKPDAKFIVTPGDTSEDKIPFSYDVRLMLYPKHERQKHLQKALKALREARQDAANSGMLGTGKTKLLH